MLQEIGKLTKDSQLGWFYSKEIEIPLLNKKCQFVFDDYADDNNKEDYLAAINNFLSLKEDTLHSATSDLYEYYQDIVILCEPQPGEYTPIDEASTVWSHVQFGNQIMVSRRSDKDNLIYLSIESECSWEVEHGLQVVFKNGTSICKLGPYDGHVTNADAYARPDLEDVIYKSPRKA